MFRRTHTERGALGATTTPSPANGVWLLPWGGVKLPVEYATEHFLALGATGSGKTVLINILMRDVLPKLPTNGSRALIYDAKQDVVSALEGMGLGGRYRILHPFDRRSYAWDMAQDIVDPVSARQLATILVPDEDEPGSGNTGFFTNAVRDLLTGVFLVFINCARPGQWTFRDVILAMLYPPYLAAVLAMNRTRDGRPFHIPDRLRQSYLAGTSGEPSADPRTASNIRSTINTKLSIYEPIAAAWQHAWSWQRTFSLSGWLQSDDILVLGNDEASRTALDAINQALFKRMTELALARAELGREDRGCGRGLTWVFFDEVREAGRLDGLSRLLTKGRTKGVAVVLGFQDIEGLRAVYGSEVANELVGQCHNTVVLKLNSPSTAQWAADLFGRQLETFELPSTNIGVTGPSSGMAEQQQERARVYTADLLYAPPACRANGLSGYQRWRMQSLNPWPGVPRTPQERWHQHLQDGTAFRLEWDALGLSPEAESVDLDEARTSYVARDPSEQYLQVWGKSEWQDRLGFDAGRYPSLDGADRAFLNTPEEDAAVETVRGSGGDRLLDFDPL